MPPERVERRGKGWSFESSRPGIARSSRRLASEGPPRDGGGCGTRTEADAGRFAALVVNNSSPAYPPTGARPIGQGGVPGGPTPGWCPGLAVAWEPLTPSRAGMGCSPSSRSRMKGRNPWVEPEGRPSQGSPLEEISHRQPQSAADHNGKIRNSYVAVLRRVTLATRRLSARGWPGQTSDRPRGGPQSGPCRSQRRDDGLAAVPAREKAGPRFPDLRGPTASNIPPRRALLGPVSSPPRNLRGSEMGEFGVTSPLEAAGEW